MWNAAFQEAANTMYDGWNAALPYALADVMVFGLYGILRGYWRSRHSSSS